MHDLIKKTLSYEEAFTMQTRILDGELSTDEMVKAFDSVGAVPSAETFRGIFDASRKAMVPTHVHGDTLDTCGTGGDGLQTFNISTIAALVCAAAGVPIAKHGNRSAAGSCGSADVLAALGVNIMLGPEHVPQCIADCGIGFMFAPAYHPAFRHAAEGRRKYAGRTYFNFLGPMLNPANSAYRVLGVASGDLAEIMGEMLLAAGVKKAWLVNGEGMDEISPCGMTPVWEFVAGKPVNTFVIDPRNYGIDLVDVSELRGGSKEENARIIIDVLCNKGTRAQAAAVVLNAAAGLTIYGKSNDYAHGIRLARQVIEDGLALEKLYRFIAVSNSLAGDI
jgi:anthranilate phosphoribosyltransferase